MRPTGLDRWPRNQRDQYQQAEAFGVLGWIGTILLIGYLGLSCLLARLQADINTKLSDVTGQPVNVELGGWVTAPGQFIWHHATSLVALAIGLIIIVGLRKLATVANSD